MYSEINQIEEFLCGHLKQLETQNFFIINTKSLPYGVQIAFKKEALSYKFNFYYSKKKGISIVSSNVDCPIYQELFDLLHDNVTSKEFPGSPKIMHWIGTDEAGKGDYFGPLVVAAFFVNQEDVTEIRKIGATDCKLLTDKKTIEIAEILIDRFRNQFEIYTLTPPDYNKMMYQCIKQNKNLNHMLAYLHSSVINKLYDKHKNTELILTDQFSTKDIISPLLVDGARQIFTQRTKAESDVAVAVASILARYYFLLSMDAMSAAHQTTFPKGATNVINFGVQLCKENSTILFETAKLHFKTTNDIKNKL